ncbi:MAG: UDP-N-acetylmuramoyl-L-alanyl-D-glutamate--2,6-diaminopimelate ligase, partial [Bauldia sp.]|nr:UDP-N-acetylmuramoyl-L-alanyl-D-glutamate--2,6-diaminopimelate ligase [Bauldia sp.]
MLLGDLATADAGIALESGDGALPVKGIASDSRSVGRGFLFAALPGSTADGAAYVGDAVGRGATAVLAATGVALDLPPQVAVLRAADPR